MRVLLDENLPHDLIAALVAHSISTVQGLGWAGAKNGDLLKRASGVTEAFVTMDGKLEYQHDISVLPFGVVVVDAPSNRMPDLRPLVPEILAALERVRRGKVEHVGRSGKRRNHLKKRETLRAKRSVSRGDGPPIGADFLTKPTKHKTFSATGSGFDSPYRYHKSCNVDEFPR